MKTYYVWYSWNSNSTRGDRNPCNILVIRKRTLDDSDTPVSFVKNVFGTGRYLAKIPKQHRENEYEELKETAEEHQTSPFAAYINSEKFLKAYELGDF